jgi:hypothetical protein
MISIELLLIKMSIKTCTAVLDDDREKIKQALTIRTGINTGKKRFHSLSTSLRILKKQHTD